MGRLSFFRHLYAVMRATTYMTIFFFRPRTVLHAPNLRIYRCEFLGDKIKMVRSCGVGHSDPEIALYTSFGVMYFVNAAKWKRGGGAPHQNRMGSLGSWYRLNERVQLYTALVLIQKLFAKATAVKMLCGRTQCLVHQQWTDWQGQQQQQ